EGQPATRQIVDGTGHPSQVYRVAKGQRRDECAELYAAGMAGKPGQRDPCVERVVVGQLRFDQMVRAVQTDEAERFDRERQSLPAVPVQSPLAFEHDRDVHGCFRTPSASSVAVATIATMHAKPVEFGVFMPVGQGGYVVSTNRPPTPATYAYNRQLTLLAED